MVPKQGKSPERSIVGALICSDQFRQLVQNDSFLGGELLEKFRVMIYSSTLAYVYDSGSREIYDSDLTMRDLHRITYAMGSDLLLFLDNALLPHQLSKLSQEQLSGLFVVIFGIALAVAYSTAVYDSPTFHAGVETGGETPRTLWQALQQHLSQMLAHHLLILGARLGLVLRGDSEKEIISSLMSAIIYRGNFIWVAQQRAVELPEPSITLTETIENAEELFVLNIPEDEVKVDPTTGALGVKKLDSYRSTPVNVRSLQTIQNTLKPIMPSDNDEEANVFMCHNESAPDCPRALLSPQFYQAACRSTGPISRAHRNTNPNKSALYCANLFAANLAAVRELRARSNQSKSHPDPQGFMSHQTSTSTATSRNALDMSPATTNSSVISKNGSGGITSSNENTTASSATSSTNLPSPFEPVSTGFDLDMDLSSDPFGIGWLPEPEPEQELPRILGTAINTSKSDNNNVPFTPSVWGVQYQATSPSIWGVNAVISPSLQHLTNTTAFPSSGSAQTDPYIWACKSAATNRRTKSPNTNNIATPNNSAKPGPSLWAYQELSRARHRQPNTATTDTICHGSYRTYPPSFSSTSQQAVTSLPPQPLPQPPTTERNNPGTTTSQLPAPFIWDSQEINNIDFTRPPNPSNPSLTSIWAPAASPAPTRNPNTNTNSSTSTDSPNTTPSTSSSTYPEAPDIYAPQKAAEFPSPNSSEDDKQIKEITLPGSMDHYRPSSSSRPSKRQKTDKDHDGDRTRARRRPWVWSGQVSQSLEELEAAAEMKAQAQDQESSQWESRPQSRSQRERYRFRHGSILSVQSGIPGSMYVTCTNGNVSNAYAGDNSNLSNSNSYFGPVKKRPVI